MNRTLSLSRVSLGVIFFFFSSFLSESRAQSPVITVRAGLPASYDLNAPSFEQLQQPGSAVQQVAYGNGVYLACMIDPPALFRSVDGKTWSKVFTGPDLFGTDTAIDLSQQPSLAYGAGRWVLASDSGRLYSSPDGLSWTRIGLGTTAHFRSVQYLDSTFYLVGDSASFFTSSDGLSWTRRNTGVGVPADSYDEILSGNGYLVLDVIHQDTFPVQIEYRTTTGPEGPWSADTLSGDAGGNLKFLKGRFYKLGAVSQISTDAHHWTTLYRSGVIVSSSDGFTDGNKVFLLAPSYSSGTPAGNVLPTADDGATFGDTIYLPILSEHGSYFNHNYYVYGRLGVSSSTDGLSYRVLGSTGSRAAAAGDSNFVKIEGNLQGSVIDGSPNFTAWTPRDTVATGLPGILYDGTQYLAEGHTIYSSPDGSRWSVKGSSPLNLDHFAYGGGKFVAYDSHQNDGLWYSTDGVGWQPATLPDLSQPRGPNINLGQYNKIRYANGHFFLLTGPGDGNIGYMLTSADGMNFTFGFPAGTGSRDLAPRTYNDIVYDPDSAKYFLIGSGTYNDGTTRFFSVSVNPLDSSVAIITPQGSIRGLPDSTTMLSFRGEASFSYSHGHFVGAVDDISHVAASTLFNSYLLWSTDGLNWDSHPIGGSTQLISNLASGDVFRMEGTSNYELVADFSTPVVPPPPPSLLDFDAFVRHDNKVLLTWRVSPTRDIRRFTIQRSTGKTGWDSIGVVEAQRGVRYHFVDESPLVGDDAYRLVIVDTNGSQQYSPVRRVHLGPPVTVWPNPVRDILNINAGTPAHRCYVLCNAFGRAVLRRESDAQTLSLFVGNLPPGIYTLFVLEQNSYPRQIQIIH